MLCDICQAIFSTPRKLSYGTYYPWGHTSRSYAAARQAGCHLCNLVWENKSYSGPQPKYDSSFPNDCTYAFRPLNADWARHGKGQKWLTPETSEDEFTHCARYLYDLEHDPTVNHLASLLAAESEELFTHKLAFWLVLDFYCAGPRIVLPLELVKDHMEQSTQLNHEEHTSTGSKDNMQLASCWLQNCINEHPQCRPLLEDESWMPNRLLYLGSVDSPVLRLVSTSSLDHRVPYAALSHRWGTTKDYILTSSMLRSYEVQIPMSDISVTMRDAFHVTKSIGLQYLWVDSMCIVQDDPDDWSRESVTMSKVYGLATCTIAAAIGGNGDDGCFVNRNPYRVRPCLIPNPFKRDSNWSFYARSHYLNDIYKREVIDSPWYNRGWVFQERTLSPRLLIFGETQILWACRKLRASETWPCGKTNEDFIDRFEPLEVEKSQLEALLDRDRFISHGDKNWQACIEKYTQSDLARMSDRLIAVQGLASQIEAVTGRRYCAGLWIDATLPSSLVWMIDSHIKLPRPQPYRAPTWSWAAVDTPVKFQAKEYRNPTVMIEIIETVALPGHEEPILSVPIAALKISGILIPVTLFTSAAGNLEKFRRTRKSKQEIFDPEGPSTLKEQPLDKGEFPVTYAEPFELRTIKNTVQMPASPEKCTTQPVQSPHWGKRISTRWLRPGISIHDHTPRCAAWCIRNSIFRAITICVQGLLMIISMPFLIIRHHVEKCCRSIFRHHPERIFPETVEGLKSHNFGISSAKASIQHVNLYDSDQYVTFDTQDWCAKCVCDVPLSASEEIEVFFLPILHNDESNNDGLILRSVAGRTEHYERLGCFTKCDVQGSPLPPKQTFMLI